MRDVVPNQESQALMARFDQQSNVIAEVAGENLLEIAFGNPQRQIDPLNRR